MPDGAGYVVLDNLGGVHKFGSATQGVVGSGATPYWGIDLGRDIVIVSGWGIPFGYLVLDGWGGVVATTGLAKPTNPSATLVLRPLARDRRRRWAAVAAAQRRQHAAHRV